MLPKIPKLNARVPKFVVRLSAVCAFFLFVAVIEPQEKKTATSPGMSGAYQILTPTNGVDFSDYMKDVLVRVRRNWFAIMPEDAHLGKKGRVFLRFQIQKDGNLLVKEPTVQLSSKDAELDKAATTAIKNSAPFKPLPVAFQGSAIDLLFLFITTYLTPRCQILRTVPTTRLIEVGTGGMKLGAAQIGSRFFYFYEDKMIHISGSPSAKHSLRGQQDRFRRT